MSFGAAPSHHAEQVLGLLKAKQNVLITGPPATGKSRLLSEVQYWFTQKSTKPGLNPGSPALLPAGGALSAVPWMPAGTRSERRSWLVTFHQGTKRHDFVNGLVPRATKEGLSFHVVEGPVMHAVRHALTPNGASLVIVDEINRGPAIGIFGDLIGAMEPDKRLQEDGAPGPMTHFFSCYKEDGQPELKGVPKHVYFLAAMNEADTSIEPIDVAFRRRFFPYRLAPEPATAASHLGVTTTSAELPDAPAKHQDVYLALVRAWQAVNERIQMGRGAEMQLGHGVLMEQPAPTNMQAALSFAVDSWSRIQAHAAEVFFGDTRGLGAVLNAGAEGEGVPFLLEQATFADSATARLRGPARIDETNIYPILSAVVG